MRKGLAGLFTAFTVAATLCAAIPAAACNKTDGGGSGNVGPEPPPEQQLFDKLELSTESRFGFETDLDGWTAVSESAAWQAGGKTGAPVVFMGDGAIIANKFELGANSKYALVNLNVKGDGDALFKAYAEYADGSEIKKSDLEIANTKAIEKDSEGYYKLGPSTVSRLAFDLRGYKDMRAAIYFEQKGQNGLEINSIAIVSDPDTTTAGTKWTAAQIASGWEMRGNASLKEDAIELYNKGKTAAVSAEVSITASAPYLKIEAKNGENGAGELALYADGELIKSENTSTDYAQTSAEYDGYLYDLYEYANQTARITVAAQSGSVTISGIEFTESKLILSDLTEWDIDTLDGDWEKKGDVIKHTEGLCLENQGTPSSITNMVQVPQDKGYLKIAFRKFVRSEEPQDTDPQVKLYVNDVLVKATGVDTDYVTTSGEAYEEFVYDLSQYKGQTIIIKLENVAGQHACFNKVEFVAEVVRISEFDEWDIDKLDSDWTKNGTVEKHNEGLCLHGQDAHSSITNNVQVPQDKGYLKIAFRKFVRSDGPQDTDPQVKLYVNGTLIRAFGVDADYVTTSGETYEEFIYDLSQFKGQTIAIKLESVLGQHACFNKVAFDAEGVTVSTYDEWDIDKLDSDWTKNGTVEKHGEGLCLHGQDAPSSITNAVQISADKTNLKIAFRKFVRGPGEAQDTDPQIKLYVNGTLLRAFGVNTDYVTTSGETYEEFIYDLSQYKGQTVMIKLESVAGQHACFNKVAFDAEGVVVSEFDEWDIEKLDSDWTKNGTVEKHNEGLCLHGQDSPSSITNAVQISDDKANLKIAFRKFVRSEEPQDTDPQIKLYVNGTLIRANDAENDYVTTSDESYAEFVYDLSQYKGQTVMIKIESVAGQHACFNNVSFMA